MYKILDMEEVSLDPESFWPLYLQESHVTNKITEISTSRVTLLLFGATLEPQKSHDYLICYNRSYNKQIPKFSGWKYLLSSLLSHLPVQGRQPVIFHAVICGSWQAGRFCYPQQCLPGLFGIAFLDRGEEQVGIHTEGFPFKQGTLKLLPSFLLKFQWGELSATKLQGRLGHAISPRILPYVQEEGRMK